MKITSLTENPTIASAPTNSSPAPEFGRSDKFLEEEQIDETTSGAIASVATPVGATQRRAKGSMFAGINTSKKFANSEAVKESYSRYGRRDAYQRDYDSSVAGMGKHQSLAYKLDGGANDEGWDEPQRSYQPRPAYQPRPRPTAGGNGMYFYNVPAGQEQQALANGLKQTRTGKWFSKQQNTQADSVFGKGRYWEPKNESVSEAGSDIGYHQTSGTKAGHTVSSRKLSNKPQASNSDVTLQSGSMHHRGRSYDFPKGTLFTQLPGGIFAKHPSVPETAPGYGHLIKSSEDNIRAIHNALSGEQGVAEGVAETLPMQDAVKVLKQYGAEHFKTTSNELHFYKNGRGLSVDLVMNSDATRSVTLSSLNSATRALKGQGVAEAGNKPLEKSRIGTGDTRTPRELKTQMQGASDEFVKSTADKKTGPFHSKVAKMQGKLAKSELRNREKGVAEESNAPTKYRATVEYGPTAADAHFVTVTATSTEEAEAKVQKWCEKKGVRNPMITINGADNPINEKSKSQAQFRTMAAVAHNPKFAKKVGISPKVGKEFHSADRKQNYKDLPKQVDEAELNEEDMLAQSLYKALDLFKKAKDKELGARPHDRGVQKKVDEVSSELLGRYKKGASAQSSQLDKEAFAGATDAKQKIEKSNKRYSGIIKATNKQFANDAKGVKEGHLGNPGMEDSPVANALTRRILMQRTDLLAKYGPEKVMNAIDEVASWVGDVDEIGSSDVSGWIRQIEQQLNDSGEQGVAEDKDPCWDNYKQIGMKNKNGKKVPNCVPKE